MALEGPSDPIGVPCEGCGARGGESCRLRAAWDPVIRTCDRQAAQVKAFEREQAAWVRQQKAAA